MTSPFTPHSGQSPEAGWGVPERTGEGRPGLGAADAACASVDGDEIGLVDGAELVGRLEEIRGLLGRVVEALPRVAGPDLAAVAAAASGVVAAARAAQAAAVLEAHDRGVIAASDYPRVAAWVEQTCREADVPVTPAVGRALAQVARTCRGPDVAPLRDGVLTGSVPVERAAQIAETYRRLRAHIDIDCWDVVLQELIDVTAKGARAADLAALEDRLVGQYGTAGALDDEDARLHVRRDMTTFRRTRTGMLEARILLDPASEAVVTAALHALSAPRPDPATGDHDPRSPGARRADALVTMARHATAADRAVPGTGAPARIVVTMTLDALRESLAERGIGTTGYGQTLTAGDVRLLACHAQIIPAVLGTRSELLDLGHARRLATPALLTTLAQRDEGCSYPGCTMPPAWTDAHHLIHWVDGGPTSLDNMALLCRCHHTVVHRQRHVGQVTATGVVWRRRDGTPIVNQPRAA